MPKPANPEVTASLQPYGMINDDGIIVQIPAEMLGQPLIQAGRRFTNTAGGNEAMDVDRQARTISSRKA